MTDATSSRAGRRARPLTEAERIQAAIDDLTAKGAGLWRIAPPVYRFAWRCGWHVPPPYYQTVLEIVRFQGLGFGVAFVLILWVTLIGAVITTSLAGVVLAAICFVIVPMVGSVLGFAFALTSALDSRHQRRKCRLPLWPSYVPSSASDDPGGTSEHRLRTRPSLDCE